MSNSKLTNCSLYATQATNLFNALFKGKSCFYSSIGWWLLFRASSWSVITSWQFPAFWLLSFLWFCFCIGWTDCCPSKLMNNLKFCTWWPAKTLNLQPPALVVTASTRDDYKRDGVPKTNSCTKCKNCNWLYLDVYNGSGPNRGVTKGSRQKKNDKNFTNCANYLKIWKTPPPIISKQFQPLSELENLFEPLSPQEPPVTFIVVSSFRPWLPLIPFLGPLLCAKAHRSKLNFGLHCEVHN